jgi:tetratricopeptide (TPR) repeat protein
MMQLQRQEPNFPQEHTKLSYLLYKVNEGEAALTEARIALAENAKNAGLALELLQKYSASEQEYQEALRLKPNYSPVRFDLGLLFDLEKKYDQAIVEHKKAIIVDPANGDIHYYLGLSF